MLPSHRKSIGYETKKETERFGSENNGVVQKNEDISAEPGVLQNSVGENTLEKYEDKSAEHRTEDKMAETNVVLDNSSCYFLVFKEKSNSPHFRIDHVYHVFYSVKIYTLYQIT